MTTDGGFPQPSPCGTHHRKLQGGAAYPARFFEVGKFHEPGLAPARDATGWYHICADGKAAYSGRFEKVWGFYCNRAAAKEQQGWTHITPSGERAYEQRYPWVGNFQEHLCSIQDDHGFHHILPDGKRAYSENFAYAGDFRDGAAVAISRGDGLCRHILPDGSSVHDKAFIELDVFHKGFARARDSAGWFHIRTDGRACYAARFKFIEPFYNETAVAHTLDEMIVRISPQGEIVNRIGILPIMNPASDRETQGEGTCSDIIKVLVTGNIGSGKSTLAALITSQFGWSHVSIDGRRRLLSDGSPAGEALAWSRFLEHAQSATSAVYECTGGGPYRHLLARALSLSKARVVRLGLRATPATCARRISGRRWETPYPYENLPDENLLAAIGTELESIWADGTYHLIPETDTPDQAMIKLAGIMNHELT